MRSPFTVTNRSVYAAADFTETFTSPLVQQHWNPRPPSPDQSLAVTWSTYSPGSLKVTLVEALPLNTAFPFAASCVTAGLALANKTLAGPRSWLQVMVTGEPL